MATPIIDTPILSGKNSERFLKKIKEDESKGVSKEDYDRAMEVDNKMIKGINV